MSNDEFSTVPSAQHGGLPQTLGQFFAATGREFRVYDVGRRVSLLEASEFAAFERAERAYPLPLRRNAWLGILFWESGEPSDPMIWFLKFPLDEQGCLVQASRDYVLRRLFEAYGSRLLNRDDEDAAACAGANVLADNPFAFRPADDRLAMFRALSGAALGHPPSRFFAAARRYFLDPTAAGDWRELGIQGIADFAARSPAPHELAVLVQRLGQLPVEPFMALCTCLESTVVPAPVGQAVVAKGEQMLAEPPQGAALAAAIRAVSQAEDPEQRDRLIDLALESSVAVDIEVLAAVAGRAWESLSDPQRVARFIERLALNDAGQEGFEAIMGELLYLPGMREGTLAVLRSSERSPQVRMRADQFQRSLSKENNR